MVPAAEESVQKLPEGVGVTGAVDLCSYDELRVASEVNKTAADRFVFGGQTFEIQLSSRQPAFAGIQPAHWEATAIVVAALPMPEAP